MILAKVLVIAAVMAVFSIKAVSAPVVVYDTSNSYITGITGLVVQDAELDVTFASGTYQSQLNAGVGYFVNNSTGAAAAHAAIVHELATLTSYIPIGYVGPKASTIAISYASEERRGHNWLDVYLLIYYPRGSSFGIDPITGTTTLSSVDYSSLYSRISESFTYTAFTPVTSVPEPGSFGLLCSAGLALVAAQRRRVLGKGLIEQSA